MLRCNNVRMQRLGLRVCVGLIFAYFLLCISTSCASSLLDDGRPEIKRVTLVSDTKAVKAEALRPYVRQRPGLVGGKRQHPMLDTTLTTLTCHDLRQALTGDGYLHASVRATASGRMKGRRRVTDVTYHLSPGRAAIVSTISRDIRDERIDSLLRARFHTTLAPGRRFSVADLNRERAAIVSLLQDNGYSAFNKEFIRFTADTIAGCDSVALTLLLTPYRANSNAPETAHPFFTIRHINYLPGGDSRRIPLRAKVLDENTAITASRPYSASDLQRTYQRFARLGALRYTNIRFKSVSDALNVGASSAPGDTLASTPVGGGGTAHALDCEIQLTARKPNSISVQPEGTNTAGDLGAAVSLVYENRNLFRGSETLTLSLRGAYEAISGLEGYSNTDYREYGIEAKLAFPRFLFPFISRTFRRSILSSSEVAVAYNLQNRPEFHRRMFSAAWRYKWGEPRHHSQYTLDVLDLNYIHMPWISETFKHDYLDSLSNHNAILRYNYSDLFIMKMGIGVNYNNGINALKLNFEFAGNLLQALSRLCDFHKNGDGQYTLFNIAYAQYVKLDVDATRIVKLSPETDLVLHGGLGVAYPYGNSRVLPFEKRYFAGGANSVRGWAVRELGPGSYQGNDGRIDFINQTGDIRLDLNAELRWPLFWKLYGAAFIDAGNIWTLRAYDSQPGGQFRFSSFLKEMAVAYGAGVRLNFNYFILRFDAGMKAVNPAYTTSREHYPIVHPRLSRDFAFHFAVGLPF